MVVIDLLGNESKFTISRQRSTTRSFSKLHKQAVQIIRGLYPSIIICEEVPVKIKPGLNLYLDIYVPRLELIVEVHGRQHYEYVEHFHKQRYRFGRTMLNDSLKQEWCELNNFLFVELPYNARDEWEARLRHAIGLHFRRV